MRWLRPPPVALLIVAILAATIHCVGWHYAADDVTFVRWYTDLAGDSIAVRWSAVAEDFIGPWGGNRNHSFFRPIVSLSLALDFQLFGLNAGVNAAINLLVHVASAICLYALARRVLPGPKSALPAALLFGLTPLAHENLAWAVGRCNLTVLFGLLSGIAIVNSWELGRQRVGLHGLAMTFATLNLLTMESAISWVAFPPLCLLLVSTFHQRGIRISWKSFVPYACLGFGYIGLRLLLLGEITGRTDALVSGGVLDWLQAPFLVLWESLVPNDSTWVPSGAAATLHRALCLFPVVLGLAAPLYFRDPRSRAYRRALLLLLGFWVLTRLPTMLAAWRLGPDLEGSRTAYYAYPSLALAIGMIAATVRYARWGAFVLAIMFGVHLHDRIGTRVAWSRVGVEARDQTFEDAKSRDLRPFALVNDIDGSGGSPVYHGGEMPLMLYPPFVPERAPAISVNWFPQMGETTSGAYIARELGRLVWFTEPERPALGAQLQLVDPNQFLETELPRGALELRLEPSTEHRWPSMHLDPAWENDPVHGGARPVLLLAAGAENLVLPLLGEGGWPAQAREALRVLARLGDTGAAFACFVETRLDPGKPATARARSAVAVGRIR